MDPHLEKYTLKQLIAVPLVFLAVFLAFSVLYTYFNLPGDEELIKFAEKHYASRGYSIVFIAALVEGLLLINWYAPGSIVAALGVTLSKQAGLNAIVVVLVIILAFFLTAIINYGLGRYGWYRLLLKFGLEKPLDKIKRRAEAHGLKIIFSTYIHPNLGALAATSAGILRLPFKKFLLYSAIATIIWNALWGTVIYIAGPPILDLLSNWTLVGLIALFIIWRLVKYYRDEKRVSPAP